MTPMKIAGANVDFGKPAGWDDARDGICGRLPVRVEKQGHFDVCCSAWKPTPEEMETLRHGGVVVLRVYSHQPPVWLGVEPQHEGPAA